MPIRTMIHTTDPYESLDVSGYVPDIQGWNSEHPFFQQLLSEIRPRRILEVGSWKGASALNMARIQRDLGINDPEIVCVDTWLGALEFWLNKADKDRYLSLGLDHGYPTVYYTFLKNILTMGFASTITPFPITSSIAARFFKIHNTKFDLIYIDGSHDYEDVISDIAAFWPLVEPGGALFGDDYDWPGVRRAVDESSGTLSVSPEIPHPHWLFRRSPFSNDILTDISFRFSRSSDAVVISPRLTLLPNGMITGHYNPNETRWEIQDGILIFFGENGIPTVRFTQWSRDSEGKLCLSGRFLLYGEFDHVLTQVD